jgi:hypothetical protein
MKTISVTTEDIQLLSIALVYAESTIKTELPPAWTMKAEETLYLLNKLCNPENEYTLKLSIEA